MCHRKRAQGPYVTYSSSGLTLAQICCIQHSSQMEKLEPNEINFSQGFSQKVVSTSCFVFISLPARGDFCCLLITFANRLDPDQTQHNVGPDQDLNCLTPISADGIENSSIQRVKYGTINNKSNIRKSKS